MHTGKEGFDALPFFDEFDLATVDVLLISQYVNVLIPATGTVLDPLTLSQRDSVARRNGQIWGAHDIPRC